MRRLFLSILIILPLFSAGQTNVKEEAEKMGLSLIRKDYEGYVRFSYPDIVKEMGGAKKMAAAIEKQMKSMEEKAQIVSLSYGEPSVIIIEGKELQCTLPQEMILNTPQGKLRSQSTLIAISRDSGKHWYFVDPGERDIQSVRMSLPNVSRKLNLTKPEPPQFLP